MTVVRRISSVVVVLDTAEKIIHVMRLSLIRRFMGNESGGAFSGSFDQISTWTNIIGHFDMYSSPKIKLSLKTGSVDTYIPVLTVINLK